ncbi:unnamed protein product [Pylaiella littoralis]
MFQADLKISGTTKTVTIRKAARKKIYFGRKVRRPAKATTMIISSPRRTNALMSWTMVLLSFKRFQPDGGSVELPSRVPPTQTCSVAPAYIN